MRPWPLALVLALPACDQVFSLDRPPTEAGGPSEVIASYYRRIASNDLVSHEPRVTRERVQMPTPSVVLADGTRPSLIVDGDGTLRFTRAAADQVYRLSLTTSAGVPVDYDFAAARLEVGEGLLGRANRAPVVAVTFAQSHPAQPAPATGNVYLVSTGLWTETGMTTNAAYTIVWANMTSLQGPMGLLQSSLGDRMYAAYHGKRMASGREYRVVTDLCESSPQPELATGAHSATCTFAALPLDRCAHVGVSWVAENARIMSALDPRTPFATVGSFSAWGLLALPAIEIAREIGLLVAYDFAYAGPVDWDADIQYSSPYPGHTLTLGMRITRSRNYTFPNRPFGTSISLVVAHAISPPDCGTAVPIPTTIGLPGVPSLDGTAIVMDGTAITVDRSRSTVLTWPLAAPGPVDYYAVRLFEVTGDPNGVSTLIVERHAYVTREPRIEIAEQDLVKGSIYFIEVSAILGAAGAVDGDLITRVATDPSGLAVIPSATFELVN